jgi:Protein of unknown function (DUF3592)
MVDLTPAPTARQLEASGVAGFLGLFAGLCTIFAACATLSDWHDEASQQRWPLVAAVVDRADLVASARPPKAGGGTEWKLTYRVHYEAGGETLTAKLTSRSAFSQTEAVALQSWAARYRKGSHIAVRIDPSQPNRAAFVSAEISSAAGRMHTDFMLLGFAAIAAAGLMMLAKYLRAREAFAGPAADAGSVSRGGPAMGLLFAAMGLWISGFAIYSGIHAADAVQANAYMGLPAGLMFVFAGALLALPPESKWRSLLATLVITCFAVTFDWIAFGPGERKFTGSIMGVGFMSGESMGRIAFGFFAILLDIFAVGMWVGECRRALGLSASPGPVAQQKS